jgi:hypothetical protein
MSKGIDKADFLVQTFGFEALEQTFRNFETRDKKRIIMAAFKKATKPLVEKAQSNILPYRKTGALYNSIGVLPLRGEVGILVGARKGGTSEGHFAGYHGHLLNDGTKDRYVKVQKGKTLKKPRFTGKMSAAKPYNRWFTKAAFATEGQAIDSISRDWYMEISKFIIRNDRKDN